MNKEQFKNLITTIKICAGLLLASNLMILNAYGELKFMIVVYILVSIIVVFLITAIMQFILKE